MHLSSSIAAIWQALELLQASGNPDVPWLRFSDFWRAHQIEEDPHMQIWNPCVKYIEIYRGIAWYWLTHACFSNQYFQKPKWSLIASMILLTFDPNHPPTPAFNYHPPRPLFSVLASTPWERLGTWQCTSWTWPWGHTACGPMWWCIMRCLPGGVGFLRKVFFL